MATNDVPARLPGADALRPPYRVGTERLLVRCFEPGDAEAFHAACARNRSHLRPWMPWAEHEPPSLEERLGLLHAFRGRFDLGIDFAYGVFDAEDGAVVGGTGLHPRCGPGGLEIGYWIDRERLRRGYATELTRALVAVAFDWMGARRVEIHCDPENEISARVPARLGFTREGVLRARLPWPTGGQRDTAVYSLLESEFRAGPWEGAPRACLDALGRPLARRFPRPPAEADSAPSEKRSPRP